jgi:catalase
MSGKQQSARSCNADEHLHCESELFSELGRRRLSHDVARNNGWICALCKVAAHKICQRSQSFPDYFSQATLFLNSMSEVEKEHIVKAAHFELPKVQSKEVKQRVLGWFAHIEI